jgi:hypothetical protein
MTSGPRLARPGQLTGTAITVDPFDDYLSLVQLGSNGPAIQYLLPQTATTAGVGDVALVDFNNNAFPDVVALDTGMLYAYFDGEGSNYLTPQHELSTPLGSGDTGSDDLLAVGTFASPTLEIEVIERSVPPPAPVCYRLGSTDSSLIPCD